MKYVCENCEYFKKDGCGFGEHLCVLKEIIIRNPKSKTCEEHTSK